MAHLLSDDEKTRPLAAPLEGVQAVAYRAKRGHFATLMGRYWKDTDLREASLSMQYFTFRKASKEQKTTKQMLEILASLAPETALNVFKFAVLEQQAVTLLDLPDKASKYREQAIGGLDVACALNDIYVEAMFKHGTMNVNLKPQKCPKLRHFSELIPKLPHAVRHLDFECSVNLSCQQNFYPVEVLRSLELLKLVSSTLPNLETLLIRMSLTQGCHPGSHWRPIQSWIQPDWRNLRCRTGFSSVSTCGAVMDEFFQALINVSRGCRTFLEATMFTTSPRYEIQLERIRVSCSSNWDDVLKNDVGI